VPAIAPGGPKVDPTNTSPEPVKIAESLILLEFIADLFPSANMYTNNPVERAQIRFFIDTFLNNFVNPWFRSSGVTPEVGRPSLKVCYVH
jgi:glutathione S-transferase